MQKFKTLILFLFVTGICSSCGYSKDENQTSTYGEIISDSMVTTEDIQKIEITLQSFDETPTGIHIEEESTTETSTSVPIIESSTTETPTSVPIEETSTTETSASVPIEETSTTETEPQQMTTYYPITQDTKNMVYKMLEDRVDSFYSLDVPAYINWIATVNPTQAVAWQSVMNYWEKINEPDFTNLNVLPEGLPKDNSLCIIVMGYQLNYDGSISDELLGRLQTALYASQQYPYSLVLVSGKGVLDISEAEVMANWLVSNGLDINRIVAENVSINTAENAYYSYQLLKTCCPQINYVAVVTSDYHVPVSCLLLEEQFSAAAALGDKKLTVVGNAGYVSNSTEYFSIKGQARWMTNLYKLQ